MAQALNQPIRHLNVFSNSRNHQEIWTKTKKPA
jgi:hypothetical protein